MSPPVRVHDSRRDGRCSREKPARLDVPRAVLGGSRRSRFSAESAIDVRFHGDSESWRPLPEMIYRHWGTPPAWRPRLGSWRWRRVAAPAATCRPVRCGEPRSARRDIRQRTENRGRGPRRYPARGGIMPWFQEVRERRRAACDDPPSLGYRAGLAPEIPVVVPASCGSACSRLSTVRCGEPRATGRAMGGQEIAAAVPRKG